MARIFDVGQEAHGVIAIGQFATGVIAIGQVATGFIAIGQVARGVFAIGQVAFGFWGAGMLVVAVGKGTGLVGLAGRRGWGLIAQLLPTIPARLQIPEITELAALQSGAVAAGWIEIQVSTVGGQPVFSHRGDRLPIRVRRTTHPTLSALAASGPATALLFVTRELAGELLGSRVMSVPKTPGYTAVFWTRLAFGGVGTLMLAIAFHYVVVAPLFRALWAPGGILR